MSKVREVKTTTTRTQEYDGEGRVTKVVEEVVTTETSKQKK